MSFYKSLSVIFVLLISISGRTQSYNQILNQAQVEKFKSFEKLTIVKTPNENYNSQIESFFTKYWGFHKEFEFVNYNDVLEMTPEQKRSKAFLIIYPEESVATGSTGMENIDFYNTLFKDYVDNNVKSYKKFFEKSDKQKNNYLTFKFVYQPFTITKKGKIKDEMFPFNFSKNIDNMEITESKLKMLIKSTEAYLNFCHDNSKPSMVTYIKSSENILEKVTLMVRKDQIGDKISEEEFREVYPYNVEFVDNETYYSTILKGDENKAVLSIEPVQLMYKYSAGSFTNINAVFGHYIYSLANYNMIGGQIPMITPYKYNRNLKITKGRVKKYSN